MHDVHGQKMPELHSLRRAAFGVQSANFLEFMSSLLGKLFLFARLHVELLLFCALCVLNKLIL